jgi:RNA polymerase sigma factor (sigma-70 family)
MEPLDSLVRAAQEGDAEAFSRIVERFQDIACASAYAMTEDALLAEDVAQEAFLEAYLNVAKLRQPAAFASWFRRIVLKQADRLTRGKRLMSSPLEAVADVPMDKQDPTEIAETNEVRAQVRHAITALPERERLVIVLFYGTGYALKDIAAFLDIPVTTVKKRLYDARQRLKEELIDVVRDVLQEQRASIADKFPAKVHLLIAARFGDIERVKELLARCPLLLNMKADPGEARNQSELPVVAGLTALHEAATHNHAQLVQLLCTSGANINTRTSSGLTPLHGAVLSHCHETAALLLAYGANPELPLSSGLTALHLAAMKGDSEMVRLLLARGATIDGRSRYGRTPLHWAALKGHVEIVLVFLAHGADHEARDVSGRTPYDWALIREHIAIATLLRKKG